MARLGLFVGYLSRAGAGGPPGPQGLVRYLQTAGSILFNQLITFELTHLIRSFYSVCPCALALLLPGTPSLRPHSQLPSYQMKNLRRPPRIPQPKPRFCGWVTTKWAKDFAPGLYGYPETRY